MPGSGFTKPSKMLSSAHRSLHPRMGRHTCKQQCYRYYIVEIWTMYREVEHGELNSVWQKWKEVIGNGVMQKPRLEFCSSPLWFHQSSWILFPPSSFNRATSLFLRRSQILIHNSKIGKALKICTFFLTYLVTKPNLNWCKFPSFLVIDISLLIRNSSLMIPSSTHHLSQDLSHPWLLPLTLQTHWPTSLVNSSPSPQIRVLSIYSFLPPPPLSSFSLVTAFVNG